MVLRIAGIERQLILLDINIHKLPFFSHINNCIHVYWIHASTFICCARYCIRSTRVLNTVLFRICSHIFLTHSCYMLAISLSPTDPALKKYIVAFPHSSDCVHALWRWRLMNNENDWFGLNHFSHIFYFNNAVVSSSGLLREFEESYTMTVFEVINMR